MSTNILARPLVPVATPEDAEATYEALHEYLIDAGATPIVVHVAEKGGGAPDKTGVEQSKELATAAFDRFEGLATTDGIEVETQLLYGTDIASTITEAAADHDATAIAFRSRGDSSWLDLVTGNVRAKIINGSDRPVIVLS